MHVQSVGDAPNKPQIVNKLGIVSLNLMTIATASEQYYLDWNRYTQTPSNLTTPVAYMKRVPMDPFSKTSDTLKTTVVTPGKLLIYRVGPDGKDDAAKVVYDPTNGLMSTGDIVRELDKPYDSSATLSTIQTDPGTSNTTPAATRSTAESIESLPAFADLYNLKPSEVLRRVAPPYIPGRKEYFDNYNASHNLKSNPPTSAQFLMNDKLTLGLQTFGIDENQELETVLHNMLGLKRYEFEGSQSVLRTKVAGDWIVRSDATPQQRVQALGSILQTQMGMNIMIEKRNVEREVIVATGQFALTPLPDPPEAKDYPNSAIYIYTDNLRTQKWMGNSGGSTVDQFLNFLGDEINTQIINQSEPAGNKYLRYLTYDIPSSGNTADLDRLLANIAKQTSLQFKRERRRLDIWIVSLKGTVWSSDVGLGAVSPESRTPAPHLESAGTTTTAQAASEIGSPALQAPPDATSKIPPAAGKDIPLANPGMEEGDADPTAWQKGAPVEGVEYIWDRQVAHSGKSSLCLKKTANRFFPIAEWKQLVPREKIGEAKSLQLSAWVRAENAQKAILDVQFIDANGQWRHQWAAFIGVQKNGDAPANHDWKQYEGVVDIPEEAKEVSIGLQIYGPGTVWFDDVKLSAAAIEPGKSASPPIESTAIGETAGAERQENITSATARLELRFVATPKQRKQAEQVPWWNPARKEAPPWLLKEILFSEKDIDMASISVQELQPANDYAVVVNGYAVILKLNKDATERFAKISSENAQREFAIVIDGKMICTQKMQARISHGLIVINANFTQEEAESLAQRLRGETIPRMPTKKIMYGKVIPAVFPAAAF